MPALTARVRWLIGGGTVVVAVAIVALAAATLSARPAPEALTYIPRDSAVVVEVRPDLPGDQLSKIGNLLAHFPGFKDQSNLGLKIDQSLAKITTSISNGGVSYDGQVKPWLAGPLFAGARPPAASTPGANPAASGAPGGAARAEPAYVIVFTTDGTVSCDPFTHGSSASETYRSLTVHEPASGSGGPSCALDGRFAIVGTLAEVKAAVDAHAGGTGMDGLDAYRAARDRLGGDRLATLFVARDAMTTGLLGGGLPGVISSAIPSLAPGLLETLDPSMTRAVSALPAWLMAGIRAEDNALVADVVTAPFAGLAAAIPAASAGSSGPLGTLLPAAPAHASRLAPILPADTLALYELHGAGITLQNALTMLRAEPQLGGSLGQLDAGLGALGGADGLVGWIGDAGLVVLPDGSSITGGLVLLAPDAATATAKADQLRNLLTLAGLSGGAKVSQATIDGTQVTLVDLGDASSLAGGLGVGGLSAPAGTHLVISIAAHGSAVLIGAGESFARQLIEASSGGALAGAASYTTALGLASASNVGQLYVAAGPLLPLVESALPAAQRGRFETDIKPYVQPFDALLETVTCDASGLRIRIVVSVK